MLLTLREPLAIHEVALVEREAVLEHILLVSLRVV